MKSNPTYPSCAVSKNGANTFVQALQYPPEPYNCYKFDKWANCLTLQLDWTKDWISWYINGVKTQTVYKEEWFQIQKGSEKPLSPLPFTGGKKFHIIMNLAIGGNWPGPPNKKTFAKGDQEFIIQWVKAEKI